ncbi:MAG: hypothetical protein DYH08_04310, partial [Actinobacteria bacterium ATB1]|nr:hypothetical protein [Actinobacteria bacterium ATB1]
MTTPSCSQKTHGRRAAFLVVVVVALVAALLAGILLRTSGEDNGSGEVGLARLRDDLEQGEIEKVLLDDTAGTAEVTLSGGQTYTVRYPDGYGPDLTTELLDADVDVEVTERPADPPLWLDLLVRVG